MITGFWHKVNGARQKKKKTSLAATGFTRCEPSGELLFIVDLTENLCQVV
jgi:hypothetical protein